MANPHLRRLVERLGYDEGMPVVASPGVIDPRDFIDTLITHRLPNPALPDAPQPSQKMFETLLLETLAGLDPARPVYVEAESRKVGNLHVPEALMARIRVGDCCFIDASLPARVSFLLRDYDYFTRNTAYLSQRLAALHGLQSNETLAGWQARVAAGEWPQLVEELLTLHYDPLYRRSQGTHYAGQPDSPRYASDDLSPVGIEYLASAIVQGRKAHTA